MTLIEGVSRDLGITRRDIPDEEILERLFVPARERRREDCR